MKRLLSAGLADLVGQGRETQVRVISLEIGEKYVPWSSDFAAKRNGRSIERASFEKKPSYQIKP